MPKKNKQWKGDTNVTVTEKPALETEAAPIAPAAAASPSSTIPTKSVTSYPDVVQARRITAISPAAADGSKKLTLADRTDVVVNSSTLSTFQPSVGDYYVMPNEGNPYCVAKSTFAVTYTVSF